MKLIFKSNKRNLQRLVKKQIKLKFFNTRSFPKRSQKEWKLIDKNPFDDTDKDGVSNFFDCKPLNRKKQGWAHEGGMLYYPDQITRARMMTPEKFLRTTELETRSRNPKWRPVESVEDYSSRVISQENVEKLKPVIRSLKSKMDIPYLEYDEKGYPTGHEGRHRATAAKQLGVKLIPVIIVKSRSQKDYGEIKNIRQLDEYNKRRSKDIDRQEQEQTEHKNKIRTKSADISIQEQREYGEEKPEVLSKLDTEIKPIEIKDED